jgi:hypothetical protein
MTMRKLRLRSCSGGSRVAFLNGDGVRFCCGDRALVGPTSEILRFAQDDNSRFNWRSILELKNL